MVQHECKQEQKIDKLYDIAVETHHAVCGVNGTPGIGARVTVLENGVFKVAAIAAAISAPIGFFIGLVVRII